MSYSWQVSDGEDSREETHRSLRPKAFPRDQNGKHGLARLVVLSGDRPGRKLTLTDEAVCGRSRSVTLHLDDAQVSRRHARVRRRGTGYLIEDLGSRNGTTVNGERIRAAVALRFGDRIQVGENLLLFTHHDPLEDQVLEKQKLEAIGRLGTGIAHDFNNLLGAVHSSLDFLDELPRTAELSDLEVKECLDDIRTATTRATEMTRRLLGFARRTRRSHGAVNISTIATEVTKLVRRTFDRSVHISDNVDSDLIVMGDRSHLHQLLMNLCINARDAMPTGGELTIRAALATRSELRRLPLRRRDEYVLITVADTGVGMDEETRKRLFEPFFTTKADEAGAGLGLATAYEVVDAHGGVIDVESRLGKGTTFSIFLPFGKGEADPLETLDSVEPLPNVETERPPLRLLLVDDEDVMRRSAARLLRRMGHHVDEADDGLEAIRTYESAKIKPDLVILDLNMPVMGGEEAFRELRRYDPDVQVMVVSGYLEREKERRLRDAGAVAVLDKPFDAKTLRLVLASFSDDRKL